VAPQCWLAILKFGCSKLLANYHHISEVPFNNFNVVCIIEGCSVVELRATFFSEYSLISVSSECFYLLLIGSKTELPGAKLTPAHCNKNLITFFRLVLFFQAQR
jgi:hypothetical protein